MPAFTSRRPATRRPAGQHPGVGRTPRPDAFAAAARVAAAAPSEPPAHQRPRTTAADLARDMAELASGREAATIEGLQQIGWTRAQIDALGDDARALLSRKVAA